jgi:hypothetical protein
MNYQRLTRKILQRLLREAESEIETRGKRRLSQGSGMAIHTFTRDGEDAAVMYDVGELLGLLEDKNTRASWYAMRGIIQVAELPLQCNGAWEVKYSAVKNTGDGGLVYGLGFAMTPNGILTPDRRQVSTRAQRGWIKQKSRGGKPFDDFYAQPSEKRTPDDPSDDCTVHVDTDDEFEDACPEGHIDLDALNRSYKVEGWEKQLYDKMKAAHEDTLRQIPRGTANEIFTQMEKQFMHFFHTHT